MTKSPMERYLDALIDAAPDHTPQVQIMFKPGNSQAAGALRIATMPESASPARGLYQLGTVAQPGNNAPPGTPDFILVTQIFSADAVQAVIIQMELPDEMKPSGLVVPEGSGRISGPGGFKQ